MAQAPFDPALVAIWIVPGQPYSDEVPPRGGYPVTESNERLSVERLGAVMMWGAGRHERAANHSRADAGTPLSAVGTWREVTSGDPGGVRARRCVVEDRARATPGHGHANAWRKSPPTGRIRICDGPQLTCATATQQRIGPFA